MKRVVLLLLSALLLTGCASPVTQALDTLPFDMQVTVHDDLQPHCPAPYSGTGELAACVDADGEVHLSATVVEQAAPQELRALLAHEAVHVELLRSGHRPPERLIVSAHEGTPQEEAIASCFDGPSSGYRDKPCSFWERISVAGFLGTHTDVDAIDWWYAGLNAWTGMPEWTDEMTDAVAQLHELNR